MPFCRTTPSAQVANEDRHPSPHHVVRFARGLVAPILAIAIVEPALRRAVTENVQLKLFVANGLFDLNTSYFATKYALRHLGLNPKLQENVRSRQYPAGHMIYTDPASLKQLSEDVASFYKDAR